VCGFEIFQDVASKAFMPVSLCMSAPCTRNGNPGRVTMQTRASKFEKFQELKIQELPEQVPVGHIPRTMTVHCRGESTRNANAGDVVLVGGIFLPTPYTGYQAMRAGLTADTYLEAHFISRTKKAASDVVDDETAVSIRSVAFDLLCTRRHSLVLTSFTLTDAHYLLSTAAVQDPAAVYS
jgi:DNA replication licensing factor MCM7